MQERINSNVDIRFSADVDDLIFGSECENCISDR